jgi:hypothetical protein
MDHWIVTGSTPMTAFGGDPPMTKLGVCFKKSGRRIFMLDHALENLEMMEMALSFSNRSHTFLIYPIDNIILS